ncbi:MAG: DNA topoisomerase, partial [Gemmataceae bacterium]
MAVKKKNSLVIVESPAKAKTIQKYLGPGFVVAASKGHVRDLPKSKLGIEIDQGWIPSYKALDDRKALLASLKKAAKGAEIVYLAPDPDREGEAIAWHLKEALGLKDNQVKRVTFNEITKKAVQEAFANPRAIDMDKVAAQEARRFLDRIVGYKISPLLSQRLAQQLSAGRVQSVAVRLIVDREREIAAFKAEEYWSIDALLSATDLANGKVQSLSVKLDKGSKSKARKIAGEEAEIEVSDADEVVVQKQELPKGGFRADLVEWNGAKFT